MIAGKLKDYIVALGEDVAYAPSDLDREFTGVSIDTRSMLSGNLFFCVRGTTHDGHDFIKEAVAKGAAAVVADRNHALDTTQAGKTPVIRVRDTLRALGDLAADYLKRIAPRKVAVTGTNGKTTCKNMITTVLRSAFPTCSTRGNLNNLYGVPLSIFEFTSSCRVAVFEFGMSTPGEIARLVEIVDPDIRVILNIGPAHLQTMKTIEAIAEAKFEILANPKSDDWAILNFDDAQIRSRAERVVLKRVSFGTARDCNVRPDAVYSNGSGFTHFRYLDQEIRVPIMGRHHLPNCLATIAVARVFGLPSEQIKDGIESFQPEDLRMSSDHVNGVTIINDAYNSNPVSIAAALETIAGMSVSGKRVALLGDMLELGQEAELYHMELGSKLTSSKCDHVILTGEFAEIVRRAAVKTGMPEAAVEIIENRNDIVSRLLDLLHPGDLLLVKASRALQLEKVVEAVRPQAGRKN